MTWIGFLTIIFLVILGIVGFRRGLVREVLSLLLLVLSVILVSVINPYVSSFLKEYTPVCEYLEKQCQTMVGEALETGEDDSAETVIQSLLLPESIRKGLTDNNNDEVYEYLLADTLSEYIAGYLAVMITNGLGFVLSFVIASIGLRIIAGIIEGFVRLPVLRDVNHLAGGVLGLCKGLLIVWIILLAVTILCSTDFGKQALAAVNEDTFLTLLYEHDIFVDIVLNIYY